VEQDKDILEPDSAVENLPAAEDLESSIDKNCETRARCGNRRMINNFLLDHPVGKILVRRGLAENPISLEKAERQRKMNVLAERFHQFTGERMSLSDAFAEVQNETDFQPKTVAQVILEVHIDKNAVMKRVFWETEGNGEEFNANRHIDHCYKFNLETDFLNMLKRGDPDLAERVLTDLPRLVEERKYVYLRDRFFQLIYDGCWAEVVDLVYQNHRHPDFSEHLSGWLFQFRYTIYKNEYFRRQIFRKMMLVLIREGEFSFESFDQFLQNIYFDMSDPEEKRQLTEDFFPTQSLYLLMCENQARYFQVRSLLKSYGIEPKFG
jgi:hypothetical protein